MSSAFGPRDGMNSQECSQSLRISMNIENVQLNKECYRQSDFSQVSQPVDGIAHSDRVSFPSTESLVEESCHVNREILTQGAHLGGSNNVSRQHASTTHDKSKQTVENTRHVYGINWQMAHQSHTGQVVIGPPQNRNPVQFMQYASHVPVQMYNSAMHTVLPMTYEPSNVIIGTSHMNSGQILPLWSAPSCGTTNENQSSTETDAHESRPYSALISTNTGAHPTRESFQIGQYAPSPMHYVMLPPHIQQQSAQTIITPPSTQATTNPSNHGTFVCLPHNIYYSNPNSHAVLTNGILVANNYIQPISCATIPSSKRQKIVTAEPRIPEIVTQHPPSQHGVIPQNVRTSATILGSHQRTASSSRLVNAPQYSEQNAYTINTVNSNTIQPVESLSRGASSSFASDTSAPSLRVTDASSSSTCSVRKTNERKESSLGAVAAKTISFWNYLSKDHNKKIMAQYRKRPQAYIDQSDVKVSVDETSVHLGVERRRIYDVINVFEAVGAVSKKAKNEYWWHGLEKVSFALTRIQNDAISNMSEFRNDALKNGIILDTATEVLSKQECDRATQVTEKSQVRSDENKSSPGSLGFLTKQFVAIFLVGYDRLSLSDVANKLLRGNFSNPSSPSLYAEQNKSSDSECKNLKTKVRRLYDVGNVLVSMNILDKASCASERNKQQKNNQYFFWKYPISPVDLLNRRLDDDKQDVVDINLNHHEHEPSFTKFEGQSVGIHDTLGDCVKDGTASSLGDENQEDNMVFGRTFDRIDGMEPLFDRSDSSVGIEYDGGDHIEMV